MSQLYSVSELEQIEPQLKELPQKYSRPASDEVIAKTKAALESKGHKVTVVSTPEEAVNLIKESIPEGASVYNAGSTTLVSTITNRNTYKYYQYYCKLIY